MYYFDRIKSPNFRMSFTANHANLVPDGVDGFIDAIDFSRVGEVRLADCVRLGKEEHLPPGQGDMDFGKLFKRIEDKGFKAHYMNAFGTLDDMLTGREYQLRKAQEAGVAV
jgi:sugar phosphate isomerase/epimerase